MVETVIAVLANLVLPFAVLSLLAMVVVEYIAFWLNLRGATLRGAIQEMLSDPRGAGLSREFFNHPLIASLAPGEPSRPRWSPPYIPARSATPAK